MEWVKHLVKNATKEDLYESMWGIHVTEVLDWDPSPEEIKRYLKFMKKSTNYNTSMMCMDVYGVLDLNNSIDIHKSFGEVFCRLT